MSYSTCQACAASSTQACVVANGTGSQTCAADGSGWQACIPTSCNVGFTLLNGRCQSACLNPRNTKTNGVCGRRVYSKEFTGGQAWVGTYDDFRMPAYACANVSMKFNNGSYNCGVATGARGAFASDGTRIWSRHNGARGTFNSPQGWCSGGYIDFVDCVE